MSYRRIGLTPTSYPSEALRRAGHSANADTTAVFATASTITLGTTIDAKDMLWLDIVRTSGDHQRVSAEYLTASGTTLTVAGSQLVATDLYTLYYLGASIGSTIDAIETEQAAQGLSLDAMVTDLAALEVEVLDQGTTLDSLETEQAAQGLTLDELLHLAHVFGCGIYRASTSGGADDTVTYTTDDTITLGGSLPWTPTTDDVVCVQVIASDGSSTYYRDHGDWTVAAGVITITGAFDATDLRYVVTLLGPVRAYDATITALRSYVTNWQTDTSGEEWFTETNATSAATNFYRVDMTGYRRYRFDYILTDGVLTVYSSTDPAAATPAEGGTPSTDWNEETSFSPLDSVAGATIQGFVSVEDIPYALLFEWVPYDATSVVTVNGRRGY